jgi:HlyD family secretion protein
MACMLFTVPSGESTAARAQPGGAIELPGYLEPFEQADLYAKIDGFVTKWNVDIGDRVKKGDVLAEIHLPELEEELKLREARLILAQATVAQAKLGAQSTAAALARAKVLAQEYESAWKSAEANLEIRKADSARAAELIKVGAIDKQTFEEKLNQVKAAEAAVRHAVAKLKAAALEQKEAEAQVAKAEADITVAEAGLAVRRAEVAQVQVTLQFATIRAPFAGVVVQRHANTGEFAGPSALGKGKPLFKVARTERMRVVVHVPQNQALLVENGMQATVRMQALKGREIKGTVARTSVELEPVYRTLRVEIDLDNADGSLRPGMQVKVILTPKN